MWHHAVGGMPGQSLALQAELWLRGDLVNWEDGPPEAVRPPCAKCGVPAWRPLRRLDAIGLWHWDKMGLWMAMAALVF